ncbi:hypothetical protein HHI36_008693, partial [Cryptolaemus montrouzieri]
SSTPIAMDERQQQRILARTGESPDDDIVGVLGDDDDNEECLDEVRIITTFQNRSMKQPKDPYYNDTSTTALVKRMIESISGTGRNLTIDNWFTSIPLAEELLRDHKSTIVGNIRKNKPEIPANSRKEEKKYTPLVLDFLRQVHYFDLFSSLIQSRAAIKGLSQELKQSIRRFISPLQEAPPVDEEFFPMRKRCVHFPRRTDRKFRLSVTFASPEHSKYVILY